MHTVMSNQKKGKKVIVMGSVHGNERIGAEILKKLKKILTKENIKGEIHLILGNPQAYKRNKRFIDEDLNRLFGENHHKLYKSANPNYEQNRAMAIGDIIKDTDFLLDIHSTIKPSVPFLYMENDAKHRNLAPIFGTKFVVMQNKKFRPQELTSSTDSFVDNHGGIGITYESGWYKDFSGLDTVFGNVLKFLNAVGSIDMAGRTAHRKSAKTKYLEVYDKIIPQKNMFTFSKDYENFDFVKAGSSLAKDGDTIVKVKMDSYIIFPKKEPKKGITACYLAHQI